jgi:hypothetical protein
VDFGFWGSGEGFFLVLGVQVTVALVTMQGLRRLVRWTRTHVRPDLAPWQIARLSRMAAAASSAELVEGAVARLIGEVEAPVVTPARWSGRATVVCTDATWPRRYGRSTRDFFLRLGDGTRVLVCAEEAAARRALRLGDQQPDRWDGPVAGTWVQESRIEPGERIQVIGRLERRIDPRAERVGDRAVPLAWTLAAADQALALVFTTRRAREPAPLSSAAGASS